MTVVQKFVFVSMLPLAIAGCGMRLMHYDGYRGDGTFTPIAAPSALCRDGYTIDLGAVDLGATGETMRALVGLPSTEAVIGLAVERRQGATDLQTEVFGAQRPASLVEVTLRDAAGHIVLSRRERLTQWIGSRALGDPGRVFLYQRGTQTEIPVAPGTVKIERFPIGADDSWGTYFTPRRGARYTLHFAVVEPGQPASDLRDVDVRLQLRALVGCL
jgi:hypothetical protein